ncbi:hypothetical protein A7U60_g998 [Sanghuangporus baumii]|uniref:Uncharacterized protein n=1 Tax=Sanghuangporus baumii TaxID=108892 RepID=A0A9Q5NC27_SANBA|nr:hypothetical protein A7U60_g998 [Sanghuangporus baumii]
MIWFTHILVFLAQALVLIHADVCRTLDVATTRTFPPRLRLASIRLHDLICSSENIVYASSASEPVTWYSAAPEPVELTRPAPVMVVPSPTRTVACLIGSDTCMLYSEYSLYADGPTPSSTEPAGFSTDFDDQDPPVPYQAPKGISVESFKARRSQPIVVEVYICLAICCIAALLGAFIVVSRIESAHARKTSNISYRRSTSPSRTDTGPDDRNNHSCFLVLAQSTTQFPFSDMVYEQAIASTHAELPSAAPSNNDETTPGTVVLGMQCNHDGNNVPRQEGETLMNRLFDSPDQQISDKLAADEDFRSGPLCIDIGIINTTCTRDIVTSSDSASLNESATRSDVDTLSNDESRVHTTAPTVSSTIDSEFVQLPGDGRGLSCRMENISLPSLLETSGMPSLECSASVSSPWKDAMNVLLTDINSERGFLDVKITSGIQPASIPLPEPLDDEFAMESLDCQHPETEPELEASGSVSGFFSAFVNSYDVDETAAISLVIGSRCLSLVTDPSGATEERIQTIDPSLIPLPEPALDESETDPVYIPLPEDDFGLELVFESNTYESSIAIEITGRPASLEDKDLHLLYVASVPLPEPVTDELDIDRLPKDGSDVGIVIEPCESGTSTTGTMDEVGMIEGPSDGKEHEDEHLIIPLGLSASIWAPSRDDLSEQSGLKSTETASHDGQGDAFKMSTSSPIAIPRSGNSFSARTPKKSIGNHRILNDAVRQAVGERTKQRSSLIPTTLQNTITQDATVAHSTAHSAPFETTLTRSQRTSRGVDVNSSLASPVATRSRSAYIRDTASEIHRNSLSTSLTINLFAKILLKGSVVLLAHLREVRMRSRNQGFRITLVRSLLLLGALDSREELLLHEHVIAEVVAFIHPLITITHTPC